MIQGQIVVASHRIQVEPGTLKEASGAATPARMMIVHAVLPDGTPTGFSVLVPMTVQVAEQLASLLRNSPLTLVQNGDGG